MTEVLYKTIDYDSLLKTLGSLSEELKNVELTIKGNAENRIPKTENNDSENVILALSQKQRIEGTIKKLGKSLQSVSKLVKCGKEVKNSSILVSLPKKLSNRDLNTLTRVEKYRPQEIEPLDFLDLCKYLTKKIIHSKSLHDSEKQIIQKRPLAICETLFSTIIAKKNKKTRQNIIKEILLHNVSLKNISPDTIEKFKSKEIFIDNLNTKEAFKLLNIDSNNPTEIDLLFLVANIDVIAKTLDRYDLYHSKKTLQNKHFQKYKKIADARSAILENVYKALNKLRSS